MYWDYKDYYNSMRTLWRYRLKYYGIHPNDRCVKFTLNVEVFDDSKVSYLYETKSILNINISTIKKEEDYKQLIKIISDFNPKWLYIKPFILRKLMAFYIMLKIIPSKSISYIESVGELLPTELKEKASHFFNAPVVDLYGSEEMNGIAYECHFNQMHVLNDNIYLECKNHLGINRFGDGEAIITNLDNKAMPLIRYNQGDIINLDYLLLPCACESNKLVVTLIKGRIYENIKIGNVELNPFMLMSALSNINNEFDNIMTCYHYIYRKARRKLICFVEMDNYNKNWFKTVERAIRLKLNSELEYIHGIDIEVQREESDIFTKKNKIFEIID